MINQLIYENGTKGFVLDLTTDAFLVKIDGISEINTQISASKMYATVGEVSSNVAIEPRYVEIEGRIKGDLERQRRMILDSINLTESARLILIVDGIGYFLDVLTVQSPVFSNTLIYQNFTLQLKADYPFWQTVEGEIATFSSIKKGFMFPKLFTGRFFLSEFDTQVTKSIINSGNAFMGMDISFLANTDVLNPELFHLNTRQLIKFNIVLKAGEEIKVQTGVNKKVTLIRDNQEFNAYQYLTEDSTLDIGLYPGDNLFRYYADSNPQGLNVSIPKAKGAYHGL